MNPIRALLLLLPLSLAVAAEAPLRLNPGDHVVLVGGATADRMQHSGYFEALVHDRFPDHRLVFRNLAAPGDEVAVRHRSENFGSPDDWLKRVKADVVLGFFGYNESFRGADGLPKFREDLDGWVKHVRGTDFSGKGAARVVLVSPVANERHVDANYPDLTGNNAAIRAYAAAIEEVAKANQVPFVDAFNPSLRLEAEAAARGRSLTINGFLLSDEGDRLLAPVLFEGLFGEKPPAGDMEKLRSAVNEKNWQWHQRYRTVDGYNVFGGRSKLAWFGQSNADVMMREMEIFDVMTANRDARVIAVAKGGDLVVKDDNIPPQLEVKTNIVGKLEGGRHEYLGGKEAISKMTIAASRAVGTMTRPTSRRTMRR
jgi:hypothetical protein